MYVQNNPGTVTYATSTVSSRTNATDTGAQASSFESALKQLNDWVKETPQQRMEDSILASMGLTRQQFEDMSGPEKEKIAGKVRETLEKELRAHAEQAQAHANIKGASVAASSISGLDALV
ncbi:hypothetical protein AB6809_34035 [Paraburkholderia sp. RCC_158]|uniref:hypothetical protein n=1 Tax=Paraburkholderia sp. RCC_158 TaxID=3239220 RepID=UPI00352408CD